MFSRAIKTTGLVAILATGMAVGGQAAVTIGGTSGGS